MMYSQIFTSVKEVSQTLSNETNKSNLAADVIRRIKKALVSISPLRLFNITNPLNISVDYAAASLVTASTFSIDAATFCGVNDLSTKMKVSSGLAANSAT